MPHTGRHPLPAPVRRGNDPLRALPALCGLSVGDAGFHVRKVCRLPATAQPLPPRPLTPAIGMANEITDPDLLTVEGVAERLGISVQAVRRLTKARKIPVMKINARCHRYRWREVEAALAKLTVKAV